LLTFSDAPASAFDAGRTAFGFTPSSIELTAECYTTTLQATGIQPVSFIRISHHQLRFACIREQGYTSCCFYLVSGPVPVANRFQGDWYGLIELVAEYSISLMGVTSYRIVPHAAPPVSSIRLMSPSILVGVVLSYNQSRANCVSHMCLCERSEANLG
jgi:hypothetical protein